MCEDNIYAIGFFLLDKSFIRFSNKMFRQGNNYSPLIADLLFFYYYEAKFMAKLQMTLSKESLIDLHFVFKSYYRYLDGTLTTNNPLNVLTVVRQIYQKELNIE